MTNHISQPHVARAPFVTIEGPDGAGKSTLAKRLAAWLEQSGVPILLTFEPGGSSKECAAIRKLLLDPELNFAPTAEMLLFCADRAQHVETVIRPALDAGKVVICDRYSDSTYAYQCYGRGLSVGLVTSVDAIARDWLTPDLTLLLDCDTGTAIARSVAAGKLDRYDHATLEFRKRLRYGFKQLAEGAPERIFTLDAERDPDLLFADACMYLSFLLESRGFVPRGS